MYDSSKVMGGLAVFVAVSGMVSALRTAAIMRSASSRFPISAAPAQPLRTLP